MAKDDIVVLNEGYELRTSKSGKTRFTIVQKSESLYINTSPRELGAEIANAMALTLREKMKGIGVTVSPATKRAREVAARAFARGESWAMKRYAGGRTGAMAPGQSDKMFQDSGRMAESITANASKDDSWRINVAANRFSADTATGGAAGVQKIWAKLLELVPEFGNVALLMQSNMVLAAMVKTKDRMIQKGKASSQRGALLREGVRLFGNLAKLAG
jgi:hypothetical protein